MIYKPKDQKDRLLLNMRWLKWGAIVLPIAFLLTLDILRLVAFPDQLDTLPGFLGSHGMIVVAVIAFTLGIFTLIGRLERRNLEQNRRLEVLNTIAKDAAAKLQLEELLGASLDNVLSQMKADAGIICLVDLEKEEHSAVSYRGLSDELTRKIQKAKLKDDPIAYQVVKTGRMVVMDRVFEDPRVAEVARREGIKSAISAPLKSEGRVNGILALATHEERHFTTSDQEFLEGIGGQLGLAIRNAVLYERSQLQNRELSALLAVGKAATSTVDLDAVISRSLDTILEVTSADAAEIWLKEGEDDFTVRCHRGAEPQAFHERSRFRVGEGIPGLAVLQREPIIIHDLPSDGRFLRTMILKAGFHTFCALPLTYRGESLGVLTVAALSKDALSEQWELRLLEGIGEHLALAIHNSLLYQQVQDMAVLKERERLAHEMHDGMGQLLGYINTQSMAVKKLLSDGNLSQAKEELTKMEEISRDLYADVREGILGLRTSTSRHNGLLSSLQEYAQHYTEICGINVEFKVLNSSAQALRLAPSAEVQMIRIFQEALTNARKHSGASNVAITFGLEDDDLTVTIEDNGRGFDPSKLPSTGRPRFGLQTMRERAEAIGGSLAIGSAPGKGTRLMVRLPLNQR